MNKPERVYIKNKVLETLKDCVDLKFPVNIKHICRQNTKIRLIPYSKQMIKYNLSYPEMLNQAETKDAFTIYDARKDLYLIFYNDIAYDIVSSNRYRWNIAHELGHVALEHHKQNSKTKIFRNNLSKQEYTYLEQEADYFASYILVPHAVLYYSKPETNEDLKKQCLVSDVASKNRFKQFKIWLSNNKKDLYDSKIRKIFYIYCFKKKCKICKHSFINSLAKYCPICGSKLLEWGDGNMKYEKLETYSNKKLKTCPVCDNDETDLDGEFCQICNTYLVNKCSSRECECKLESNARYCPICGESSIFYRDNILKSWNYQEPKSLSEFMNIPDGTDEELPFN